MSPVKSSPLPVSDIRRMFALIAAAPAPLATRDLAALCHLLSTERVAAPWVEVLRPDYAFEFDPAPRSVDFSDDLAVLKSAGYAVANSPLEGTSEGRAWAKAGPRWSELLSAAKSAHAHYSEKGDFLEQSLGRARSFAAEIEARLERGTSTEEAQSSRADGVPAR